MLTSSAKAKGRRAAQELAKHLLAYSVGHAELTEDDIKPVSSSVTGEDIGLSSEARKLYPFTFEVKNQESIQIWKALKQSESHAEDTGLIPILCFKRNHSESYVSLRLSDFLHLFLHEPKDTSGT